MDDTFNLYPMFSTPMGVIEIGNDIFDKEKLLEKCVFNDTHEDANGSYSTLTENGESKTVDILSHFPEEKEILMSYFNSFKNDGLKLSTTDFVITTSWVTKIVPGGYSQSHCHKNSVFSAIFYFDDVPSGKIAFQSINIHNDSMLLNNPDEWTPFTGKEWVYPPEKNNMLIFPSSVYHRVTTNNSEQDRYSLAINFFPTGKIGYSDSYINFETI